MHTILSFLKELRRSGRKFGVSPEPFFEHARRVARNLYGVNPNPIGANNKKVGGPSTYRPVGSSCPDCPYEDTCYAGVGHAGIQSRRSSQDLMPSLFSFAIAIIYGERFNIPIRLHTTGGFARPGKVIDEEYLKGLMLLGAQSRYTIPLWAWSYTHFKKEEFEPWRLLLKEHGVAVMYSDRPETNGAVIWDFEDLAMLKALFPTVRFAQCRYQVDQTPCVNCRLCLEAEERGISVVFKPHSQRSKRVSEASRLILERAVSIAPAPPAFLSL